MMDTESDVVEGSRGEVVAVEGLGGGDVVEEVMILWVDVGEVVVVVEGRMVEVGGRTVLVVAEAVVDESEVVTDVVEVDVCEVALVEVGEVVVVREVVEEVVGVVVEVVESVARLEEWAVKGSSESTS